MDHVLTDDLSGSGSIEMDHRAFHLFIEAGQKTVAELIAIFFLQAFFDLNTLDQPEPGEPPVSIFIYDAFDPLVESIHGNQVRQEFPLQQRRFG
jgi:hypothetical protein